MFDPPIKPSPQPVDQSERRRSAAYPCASQPEPPDLWKVHGRLELTVDRRCQCRTRHHLRESERRNDSIGVEASGSELDPCQEVDYQSGSGVRAKKRSRDRLIRLAHAHPGWVVGFSDETWWSRLAQPALHTWTEPQQPLRLVEQTVAKNDPDPKALACYGLIRTDCDQMWLRFVDGRPVSAITTQFLAWCLERLEQEGKTALILVWDNASWHISATVRAWVRQHNRTVKQTGHGVRLLCCLLPVKSPWLNPIEPHWVHGKRAVAEPARLLTGNELADRVCSYFTCPHDPHLALPIPEKVA